MEVRFLRQTLMVLVFLTISALASAQSKAGQSEYVPHPYQEGKDVVWVPTAQVLADKMLDLAKVTPHDYVIDLGSGDGRLVITAAKRGARAMGIEYNPDLVALARKNALREGVADRAKFIEGDLFESDFSQATVITMFLLPEINLKLRPRILKLKPGTRIVSNSFDMKEWRPDMTITVEEGEKCSDFCEAYFWLVPAPVAGVWRLGQNELTVTQSFQTFWGSLKTDGQSNSLITNGRLSGNAISFVNGDDYYSGSVKGDTMELTLTSGGNSTVLTATRVGGAPAREK